MLPLPTDNPGEDMEIWRHVGGDRFRLVRQDKTLGMEATFLRDASGKVTSMRIWGGVRYKRLPLASKARGNRRRRRSLGARRER